MKARRNRAWLVLWAFLALPWLAAGCNLCTKHLALYRDTETKSLPASEMALVITDPEVAGAVSPGARGFPEGDCPWMSDRSAQESDTYRLSINRVDGKAVYQGMCLDTPPTYSLEARPGPRQLQARLDLYGPGGHEKIVQVTDVNLEAGGAYFLQPDCQALKDRRLILKVQRLPDPYTAQLRSRVMDWNRQHDATRRLAD